MVDFKAALHKCNARLFSTMHAKRETACFDNLRHTVCLYPGRLLAWSF